jgi:hypothetical protein
MDPITGALVIGGAASLGSGIFQWLNSKEAQRATDRERAQMQELLNKVQDPQFDTRDINPQEIRVLEQYSPQIAALVPEKSPELIQAMSEGSQKGRQAQTDSLAKFQELAKSGVDPILALQQARAQRQAQAQAQSSQRSIDELNQRRGVNLGSGVGLASQMQAIQNAQLQQALAGEQANAEAYQRQALNLQNAANLGGQIRNEDVDLEARNLGAINDYNRRMAGMQNEYGRYRADTTNQAQMTNIDRNQRAYEANIGNRYNAARDNRQNQNTIAQQQYGNRLDKLGLQMGISNQRAQDNQNRAAINNRAIQGVSDAVNTGALAYGQSNDPLRKSQQNAYDAQSDYYRRQLERN